MGDGHDNRVYQRSASLGLREQELAPNVVHVRRKTLDKRRPIGEGHQKELVLRIRGGQHCRDRIACPLDFSVHAAAYIEYYADRNGGILLPEAFDWLCVLALIQLEVFPRQPGDDAVGFIHDCHRH